MADWPSILPTHQKSSAGFTQGNNIIRDESDSGLAYQRQAHPETPWGSKTWQWVFSDTEWLLFDRFRKTVAAGWFTYTARSPGGFIPLEVRFVATPSGPTQVHRNKWAVSASVEIRDPLPSAPDYADLLPELFAMRGILDVTMNREWPRP